MARSIPKKVKDSALQAIRETLKTPGKSHDWRPLRALYPDVSRATFYRWVRQVRDEQKANAANAIKKKVRNRRRNAGSEEKTVDEAAKMALHELPQAVSPDDIATYGTIPVIEHLNGCIEYAQMVINHSIDTENEEEPVKDPQLLLQASDHLRRSLETAVKVAQVMHDVRRVEQFHQAIFKRLKARDPLFVEQVLADLREINKQWGISA